METVKKFFKDNEWALIQEVLKTGRKTKDNKTIKWIDYAETFKVKRGESTKQRATAANDIWRRFVKHVSKSGLDLTVVKQTLNGNGDVLFETRKALPNQVEVSTEGMVVDKITKGPYGDYVSYRKENVFTAIESVTEVVDRLFAKYETFEIKQDTFFKDFLSVEDVPGDDLFVVGNNAKLAVLNLYDAHLDKLPIKSVCGVESSLEENIATFKNTIDRILPYIISNKVEKVIFPVGNDLFHTNGFNSQTKKGTQIEYYGSPEDSYYAICDTITETILKISQVADVEVIMIKGNHDEDKITTLGYWLERVFRGTNVKVDFLRKQR